MPSSSVARQLAAMMILAIGVEHPLRSFCDVIAGVLERDELATARQCDRIIEPARPPPLLAITLEPFRKARNRPRQQ
jgi:hypothetical protein